MAAISSKNLPPLLLSVAADVEKAGGEAFLVGGWVRDYLLGIECGDFDVEVYGLELDRFLTKEVLYRRAIWAKPPGPACEEGLF